MTQCESDSLVQSEIQPSASYETAPKTPHTIPTNKSETKLKIVADPTPMKKQMPRLPQLDKTKISFLTKGIKRLDGVMPFDNYVKDRVAYQKFKSTMKGEDKKQEEEQDFVGWK